MKRQDMTVRQWIEAKEAKYRAEGDDSRAVGWALVGALEVALGFAIAEGGPVNLGNVRLVSKSDPRRTAS